MFEFEKGPSFKLISDKGNEVYQKIFEIQKKRIYKVLLNSTSEEVAYFNKIIKKLINEKI